MLKVFREIINEITSQNDQCELPLDKQYLGIMRLVFLKKNNTDLSLYIRNTRVYSFVEADINWTPNITEVQLDKLRNMDMSFFNAIGDEYLIKEQRDSTGSFYTPSGIVDFMVSDVIKNYLINATDFDLSDIERIIKASDSIIVNNKDELDKKIIREILNCRVIDIASGSGVFLINYVRFVKMLLKNYYSETIVVEKISSLICNNIFATDIRSGPLEMLLMALFDEVNLPEILNGNAFPSAYCCNSIHGDNLLNLSRIKLVMDSGGFEIVIGNPPYIGEKGNKAIFEDLRKTSFGAQYYEGKMDLFYFFIYRGYNLLSQYGVLSFITTNYFVTADGAKKLRKFMTENVIFKTIVNFNGQNVFSSMKGHNMIFTFVRNRKEDKNQNRNLNIKYYYNQVPLSKYNFQDLLYDESNNLFNSYYLEKQKEIYDTNNNINIYPSRKNYEVIKSIEKIPAVNLGSLTSVNQGIVSGADKVSKQMYEKKLNKKNIELYNINMDDGIFVLNESEADALKENFSLVIKPFYKNSDINSFVVKEGTERSILYIDNHIPKELINLISDRFTPYIEVLDKRREVKNGLRPWYALQWPRKKEIFESDKIVAPQRSKKNKFAWTNKPWYASADVYYITSSNNQLDLKVLLGYLNSKLVYYWLFHRGKRKGKDLELYATPLKSIPVPMVLYYEDQIELKKLVEKIMINLEEKNNGSIVDLKNEIDKYIYNLLDLDEKIINEIETFFYSMHKE